MNELSSDAYNTVNEEIYQADPEGYFRHRLVMTVLSLSKAEELEQLVAEGAKIGNVQLFQRDPPTAAPPHHLEDSALITELITLYQHAAEVLLRSVMAHAENQTCPPLAISAERDFRALKRRIEKVFVTAEDPLTSQQLEKVILGGAEGEEITVNRVRVMIENVRGYLKHFATEYLKLAPMYNAAKHGFVVSARREQFSIFESENPERGIGFEGPTIVYLEQRPDKRWLLVRQYFSVESAIIQIDLMCRLIGQVWEIGKLRHTGREPDGVHLFDRFTISEILSKTSSSMITSARFQAELVTSDEMSTD